jgi:uncharacterized protein YnzC (UPF0291/DUF896 family)
MVFKLIFKQEIQVITREEREEGKQIRFEYIEWFPHFGT